jgi:molybdate transport system substrate-binding protein
MSEADAGVVYVSDVAAAGNNVEAVSIPDEYNVIASYPIAVLKEAADASAAQSFVTYVLSPAGERALKQYGFLPP